jgi:AraC-like DNA-binding protein
MREIMLTIRLPNETRANIRAVSAVTGLTLQEVVVSAFEKYYTRLPRALRDQVEQIADARRRYGV